MAIKTFTAGSVLNASDTNTYLANSGLVYVTSVTVGSGVSSVTINNCFSSTYDAYQIVVSGGVGSQRSGMFLQLGSSTTNYYNHLVYSLYSSGAYFNVTNNNTTGYWQYAGIMNTGTLAANIFLAGPYLAKPTTFASPFMQDDGAGNSAGYHSASTSYTGFTYGAQAGTMTGGTVTVYGYRKA